MRVHRNCCGLDVHKKIIAACPTCCNGPPPTKISVPINMLKREALSSHATASLSAIHARELETFLSAQRRVTEITDSGSCDVV